MQHFITAVAFTSLALGSLGVAFGAEKTKASPGKTAAMELTTEQRQNMATAHEKMATCLRSDKPFGDCRMEMMKTCEDMMGKEGCSMMHEMHEMHGMHGMKGKEMKHHEMMEDKTSNK